MDDEKKGCLYMAFLLLCLVVLGYSIFGGCGDSSSSDDDYTTYYIDDNDNGKLDRGESNYTEDPDGNVVDWDEDLSNYE